MIKEIRAYLKSRIADVDTSLFQIDDPIGDDSVPSNELNNGYKIIFKPLNTTNQGNSYSSELDVEIYLYKSGGLKVVDVFDELFTRAILVRDTTLDPQLVKGNNYFNDILAGSIVVNEINTNDKTFQAIISLKVLIITCY